MADPLAVTHLSAGWTNRWRLKHADHLESLGIPYEDVVANPLEQARRMKDFLGLPLDPEQMAGAVDAKLYRNRA